MPRKSIGIAECSKYADVAKLAFASQKRMSRARVVNDDFEELSRALSAKTQIS